MAAPLTRLPLTPPPQSMSSRQLSSDAGAATSMSLTDKRLAMFKHQPSSPDVLLGKSVRMLSQFQNPAFFTVPIDRILRVKNAREWVSQ